MRITIGIPCYQGVPAEVMEDYMRMAYSFGRRYTEHEFFLAIKSKSEQFRARNAIVEAAIQVGSDYLLFLDDDMVVEWHGRTDSAPSYNFLHQLLQHDKDIIGALYYQRGGECRPVLMRETEAGAYRWLNDHEVKHELQRVDVQGGGCMLINMRVFDKVPSPWFVPETDLGTDIQICRNAAKEGFEVWCDTSIELGHVKSERIVVTSRNRHQQLGQTAQAGFENRAWVSNASFNRYLLDVQDYSGKTLVQMESDAIAYKEFQRSFTEYPDPDDYYLAVGSLQLSRQVCFHSQPECIEAMDSFLAMVDTEKPARGLDYGCGSAPIGFELALRGHAMTFIDLDGAAGYEFTKWRANKYPAVKADFEMSGEYDYVLMMDFIEHVEDWPYYLAGALERLKEGGFLLTNFFQTFDALNPEHVNLDHAAVRAWLLERGFKPFTDVVWMLKKEQQVA